MNNRGHASHGFSLVEVLIVVAIVGVLATFAIMALGSSAANLERQNIAKEFKIALERARFDSVKRRPSNCADQARVVINGPTSFSVISDQDQNGALDLANETRVVDFEARGNTGIVAPDVSTQVIFRFDDRGHVTSGPCDTPTDVVATVTFCQLPCAAADSSNSSLVFISPTGTASVLTGGSTIPDFSAPTVSNTSTDDINPNPLLAIWDLVVGNTNTTPTPTPAPTSTPTPTPTPTPTSTPTSTPTPVPTPTPTLSPTPTPTPVYCPLGGRPAVDNCQCGPGQYEQGGRCRQAR